VKGDNPPKAILGAESASMRQIGWELLETLKTLDKSNEKTGTA
jgi:hypothetical protein